MCSLSVLLRSTAFLLAVTGVLGHACAQGLNDRPVTPDELRRALIWTGHFSVMTHDDPQAAYESAVRAWQKSRKYTQTRELADDQASELLIEGDTIRESFGWAKLEDKSIGFSVGVPARYARFVGVRNDNGGLRYDMEGAVQYTLGVRYGDLNCNNVDSLLSWASHRFRPTFRARWMDGFVLGNDTSIMRVACRTTGVVLAAVDIPRSEVDRYGVLMSAMAESLTVARNFNPTATPRPKLDVSSFGSGNLVNASTRPAAPTPADKADNNGRTDVLKRETRAGGADLSVEQVFAKVSPAVYVVKAGNRMGSAVAVSEHELLTNCHVVKENDRVSLTLEKKQLSADVISKNDKADRCVLRAVEKLGTWVSIRPYDDIKVGERALTIGTPQGLELTVAEGIVSSKRQHNNSRLIQTSAPISQGSSGGGLFDAAGHLLGITTFYFKAGQNLNFAVAAEEYAR